MVLPNEHVKAVESIHSWLKMLCNQEEVIIEIYIKNITFAAVTGELRVKRQEEDGGDDVNAEQLCDGRPADEYFRLTTEGDCRDVVR